MDPVTIAAIIKGVAEISAAGIDYFGGGATNTQQNTGRPNQIGLQDTIIDRIQNMLNGGNNGKLSAMSQNALNRFHSQTVPSLADRFSAMGSGGSQRSSDFAGSIGSAGAGLDQQLQEMDFNQILQLLGPALGQSSENIHTPGSNFWGNAAQGIDTKSIADIIKSFGGSGTANTGKTFASGTGILGNAGDYTKGLNANANWGIPNIQNRLGGQPF